MPILIKIAVVAVVLVAGITDLRERRIPNWLNLSGVTLGFGLNALLLHSAGVKLALAGLGLAGAIYLPLFFLRAMGAGDVKLMLAIGSLVGATPWLDVFLATAILGGVASLGLIFARNRLSVTANNMSIIVAELLHGRLPFRKEPSLDVRDKRSIGLPHGTVIAIATVVVLLFGPFFPIFH